MLTKDDIKLLVDNFPTRTEFDQMREDMVTKDDHRKVLGLVESVYIEVKKIREEQSTHFNEHRRINDDLESIDKRVGRLENPSAVAHKLKK